MDMLLQIIIEYDNQVRLRKAKMIKRKFLRDISNPFDMQAEQFRQHYRMYQWMAIDLINLIRDHLPNHPRGVPPQLQVLCVLRFLAEGSYQKGLGTDENHCMSRVTVSKYLHTVIPAINIFVHRFIRFPSTRNEREFISRRFQEVIGFPAVLGAVDCTLPKIVTPAIHEEAFLNYKREHSLSLQVVADMNYNILSTRICSGSTNDRFVWNYSDVREKMYQLREDQDIVDQESPYYIIGDGGYTQSRVLMIPIRDAIRNTPEHEYSRALRLARVKVENVFGLIKGIWRCLNKERCLYYEPVFAAQIVQACTVLYNFLRQHGMPIPPALLNNEDNNDNNNINNQDDNEENGNRGHEEYIAGVIERQRIINTYFNNLFNR